MTGGGAGSGLAGIGLAGPGEYQAPGSDLVRSELRAAFYDPAIRDYRLIEGGYYESIHPADQEAILALTIAEGSIPSAPDIGSRFHLIKYLTKTIDKTVDIHARYALRRLLDRQDIEYLGSRTQVTRRSSTAPLPSTLIFVDYFNLRLDPVRTAARAARTKSSVRIPLALTASG